MPDPTFPPPSTGLAAMHRSWLCHSHNFDTDPVLTYILHPWPSETRLSYIRNHFWRRILISAALQGAIFDEAYTTPPPDDSGAGEKKIPDASAVWYPPGASNLNPLPFLRAGLLKMVWEVGVAAAWRTIVVAQGKSDRAKKRGLVWPGTRERVKRFHYMFLISTLEEARGRGLSSRLIRGFMQRVEGEGLPIWAEATTERARRVYLKCGFRDVEMYRLGVGQVDEDGREKKGGEGVRVWAIVWFPPGTKGWDEEKKVEAREEETSS